MSGRSAADDTDAPWHLDGGMITHPGRVRQNNEDVVAYLFPRRTSPTARFDLLALVADGMGGHAAGEVASQLAADTVITETLRMEGAIPSVLQSALEAANQAVFSMSRSTPGLEGMGTTCTAIAISEGLLYLGHVGDSRAYVLREGVAYQISEDHSLVALRVRQGLLSEEEARTSVDRNIITQALGIGETAAPQVFSEGLALRLGDTIVLCSDGLSDLLEPKAIAGILVEGGAADACERLLQAALQAGGHDNISVGVFSVRPPPKPGSGPQRTTNAVAIQSEAEARS